MWGSGVKGGFVRLFYPSVDEVESGEPKQKPYWLSHKEYAVGMIKYARLPSWLLGNAFYWLLGLCMSAFVHFRLPSVHIICINYASITTKSLLGPFLIEWHQLSSLTIKIAK